MNRSHALTAEEIHHNNKNRNFLRILLVLVGVIILLASIFLIAAIYRTLKSGANKKSLTILDSNLTDFTNRSERACLYGETECEYGAICTEENICRCIFNCTDDNNDNERALEEINRIWYSNKCRFDQAKCNSFYDKRELTCSSIICSHGAKCRLNDNGLPHCYCPQNCNEYIRTTVASNGSVCGSDHQTYETICDLNRKACQKQENLTAVHLGKCQHCHGSNCILNNEKCDPYIDCSLYNFQPICASNLHNYSNECQMHKYACQSNINLTKLHDGICYQHEQEFLREACKTLICLNGKSCMIENGIEVCRCLFNCSSENKQICASNGILYRNLCEMERERCIRGENVVPVDRSYCKGCEKTHCPYGRCKQQSDQQIECECKQCSNAYTDQDLICGDNAVTYPSKCHLEHDSCRRQIDIKPLHIGQCDNCRNVICPFNGLCRSEQGNYTCLCPTQDVCPPIKTDASYAICGSNQELFYSQCEMDIRSCELKTHIYTIAPHYCMKDKQQTEFNYECGHDEPLIDLMSNQNIECDTMERCPLNSYCNKQTHRCCVKVLTAVLPYRMCLDNQHCGKNMVCLNGLCQCARDDLIPAQKRRECIPLLPHLSINSTCHASSFGCCKDNMTISPTYDRRGCPEYCNCHPTGSLRSSCDPTTNACYCRPAVNGLTCSHCENEYWAFSRILTHNNTGCTPCGCHPYGSIRKDCSQDTGQCSCHPYTTGRQCDKCIDSTLALTEHGCVNLYKNHRRRRQRTCQDLICLFDGICELINGQPKCTCHQVICRKDELDLMNICASDGRTYKSICDIKRQQCMKQYEIVLMYLGTCNGNDEDLQTDNDYTSDYALQTVSIDSKRCITDNDCGENMVCLSEFCECAKQKYKRIAGPRCIMPQFDSFELNNISIVNPVRHISRDVCIQGNLCENDARCHDQSNGTYKCLCAFGWKGRYCNEKIELTIPHFNRQSFLELKSLISIKYLDLTFTSERRNGLIFYLSNKLTELNLIVSIKNKILEIIIIHFDQLISTIQLPDMIDLNTFIRLQVSILFNEIQVKINNGNILSRLVPFEILLGNTLYIGGLPEYLTSVYQKYDVDEGLQGCIHKFSINGREFMFNNTDIIGQNIDQCATNLCRTKSCQSEIYSPLLDRCSTNPCEKNHQCINIYPNNYLCLCSNCSSNNRSIVGFHSNSYIKHLPFQLLEHSQRFKIEIWFLSESSSGLLIYSEHINAKKGHIKLYIQRRIIIFNVNIGSRSISLSSRYPIELNKWHQCIIEIYGQKMSLILNQQAPVIAYELFSSNLFWPRSFTFIGHLPNQYQSKHSYLFEGFRGAIQKIIFNNNHTLNDIRLNAVELFNITEYHGYPCQPNPCSSNTQCYQTELNNYTCIKQGSNSNAISLELDGTVNAIYPYIPINFNRNYFDLLIKTKYSFGLIFYIGDTSLSFFSSYLSLTLIDGFIKFTVKIDMNSTATIMKSKIRIDDGRWHRIEIERFRRRIIMKVDDNHRYQTILPTKQIEFNPNPSYIYIGGYHRLCSYDDQHCRSYRGCLKNFTIDNNSIHLINDEINQHRILKQCHDFI